jgi:hypothetical protein
LGLITSEIEPEESLPEHHIPDQAALPPDAAVSGEELVAILQQEIKHWRFVLLGSAGSVCYRCPNILGCQIVFRAREEISQSVARFLLRWGA